ncbi:restriction endonuclease subunit S [Elizabethkingia anophelis]|uniref:restriction endonuclease subunit S n=1 Tax=Elizabethkingia anophelis TaxID=1117645 RepID=UPI0021A6154B|nr:restriction endonuclease subunit S [Elizabethkingia anophelis]
MKTKLKDVLIDIISGEWGDEDIEGKGVPIIRTTNFTKDGRIDYSNIEYRLITKKVKQKNGEVFKKIDEEKIEKKKLLDGDIIIEKSGGGIGSPVGRVVYFTSPDNKVYLCNNFTQALRTNKSKVLPKYVFYFLKYLYDKGTVLKYQNQTTGLFNLKLDRYLEEEIFIPELDIQHLIITQLDVIRNVIELRKQSISLLDELLRSIFLKMFGDPITNPYKIKTLKISNPIFSLTSGITPSRSVEEFYGGSIPWVKSTDINKEIILETEECITETAIEKTSAKIFPKDSVLLAMYGQGSTRGKVAILGIDASANQACAVINSSKISHIFLYSFLKYSYEYLRSLSKGGNRDNLSLSEIKKINVLTPKESDVLKYEEFFHSIQSILSSLVKHQEVSQEFFKAILQLTFNDDKQIDEVPIFKELMKKFTIEDLKGNKKRLQYLLNLFAENKFDNTDDYGYAKGILFELINIKEIEQKIIDDKIGLVVNETN